MRVATLNLLNDDYRRQARLNLAAAQLKELAADVIFLQEVNTTKGVPESLKKKFPDYQLQLADASKPQTIAILSRQKPLAHEVLALSQGRIAQKIILQTSQGKVNFINVHLYFSIARDKPRLTQAKQLIEFAAQPAVIAGDFNAHSRAPSMRELSSRYQNVFTAANGQDPDWTSPTPLWRGPGVRHSLRRGGLNVAAKLLRGPFGNMHGAIDHILASKDIRIVSCTRAFDKSFKKDPTLYASDHYGLIADLEL